MGPFFPHSTSVKNTYREVRYALIFHRFSPKQGDGVILGNDIIFLRIWKVNIWVKNQKTKSWAVIGGVFFFEGKIDDYQ